MPMDWLKALERLRAIAQTGLTYTEGAYDLERYREVIEIASRGLAELLETTPAVVADRYSLEQGYPTPKVDVRTAVFSEGRILLVKEAADGLWTMPGGWADETDSPREAAERETLEESGYRVKVTRVLSIKDRQRHDYQPKMLGGCYKLFFLATLLDGVPTLSLETTGVDFFDVTALPPLSLGRTLKEDILHAYAAYRDPSVAVELD